MPSFALSTIFSISVIYYRAIWFESELGLRTEDLVPKSVKRMESLWLLHDQFEQQELRDFSVTLGPNGLFGYAVIKLASRG